MSQLVLYKLSRVSWMDGVRWVKISYGILSCPVALPGLNEAVASLISWRVNGCESSAGAEEVVVGVKRWSVGW